MQAKTSPQYWFQLPAISTEELTQIWESGVAVDHPEINLELVEQVLMARNVLAPSRSFLDIPQVGSSTKTVFWEFQISQKIGQQMSRRWDVSLKGDRAVFTARDGNDRFFVDREKGRPEFQFTRSGFLLLTEGTSAIVRGRTFDFGAYKRILAKWLPARAVGDLRKEQTGWGIMMILIGALTLLLNRSIAPIIGSMMVLLGVMNFILHNPGIWIINGLGFLVNGALMLSYAAFSLTNLQSSIVVTLFWGVLGLLQVVFGFQAANQYNKF